ncbi:homoserine O-acetyltransferase MetX [Actinomyces vulturis]|uniref:homoserine O-acetyltransferase MetX n=1 Tax=Actinomyces vulturis TaxID=1857645 RepID=UPI000834BAE0|nr:homoserine O-acetyltransferase [Actinomyces vulturis]
MSNRLPAASSYDIESGQSSILPPTISDVITKTAPFTRGTPTGAWKQGSDPGYRQFCSLGEFPLESGAVIPHTVIAYETWGELNDDASNAVLFLHALTGDSHVAPHDVDDEPGWWADIVGPGKVIDPSMYFVVAMNMLGGCQGSTGPSTQAPDGKPWGGRFPWITTRDAVRAEEAVARQLGIRQFACVIGASLGGHRALEWALMFPDMVRSLIVVASGPATTADQMAWCHIQEQAISNDPYFFEGNYYDHPVGPVRGLGLARSLAHTTYRSAQELDCRFARQEQTGEDPTVSGRFEVESYLDYHASKLVARFDANTYLLVTHSMLLHDVGQGRGGVESALALISCPTLVISVDSDRLFLPHHTQAMAQNIPQAELRHITTPYGHDGFLIEVDQVASFMGPFLRQHT